MSHLCPIEMSDCPSSDIVAWEADDFGMGADERTRRTATRGGFGRGFFRADGQILPRRPSCWRLVYGRSTVS